MRLKISCRLKKEGIPRDYHRCVLSLIKLGLSQTDTKLFDKLYSTNECKHFTWSLYMQGAKFISDEIIIPNKKLILNFSTSDAELAVAFYNAFASLLTKFFPFGKNEVQIEMIESVSQPIVRTDQVKFRTLSPIVAREHSQVEKKDWFYSVEQNLEKFMDCIRQNACFTLDYLGIEQAVLQQDLANLSFTPCEMKKTVVKHYDKMIEGSLGTFILSGSPYLLNEFQMNGLGSLTGSGFGFIEAYEYL